MSRLLAVVTVLALLTLVACRGRHISLPWVESSDRAELQSKNGAALDTIAGERLVALKAVLRKKQDGWEIPWAGVPIAPYKVVFFRGTTRLGTVGIGDGFLTVGPALDYSRGLDPDEQLELGSVLKLPPFPQ